MWSVERYYAPLSVVIKRENTLTYKNETHPLNDKDLKCVHETILTFSRKKLKYFDNK